MNVLLVRGVLELLLGVGSLLTLYHFLLSHTECKMEKLPLAASKWWHCQTHLKKFAKFSSRCKNFYNHSCGESVLRAQLNMILTSVACTEESHRDSFVLHFTVTLTSYWIYTLPAALVSVLLTEENTQRANKYKVWCWIECLHPIFSGL